MYNIQVISTNKSRSVFFARFVANTWINNWITAPCLKDFPLENNVQFKRYSLYNLTIPSLCGLFSYQFFPFVWNITENRKMSTVKNSFRTTPIVNLDIRTKIRNFINFLISLTSNWTVLFMEWSCVRYVNVATQIYR